MCWLVVKDRGLDIPEEYIDEANKKNSDGYGVSWYEGDKVNTLKTFELQEFKWLLEQLTDYPAIVHLRNSTAGTVTYGNIHPFNLDGGVMYHNGTIFRLRDNKSDKSDTQIFADMLNSCSYKKVEDIMPLIEHTIGNTINRLAFMEDDGDITIVNQQLGIEEDGIWYSNDYHVAPKPYVSYYDRWKEKYKEEEEDEILIYDYEEEEATYSDEDIDKALKEECTVEYEGETMIKVFTYGTLKRGYGNHHLVVDSPYLGTAASLYKWGMTGRNKFFPYLLEPNNSGYNIKGELYLANEDTMRRLDMLEGYPTHYCYDIIDVIDEDGEQHEALVYVKTNKGITHKSEYIESWPNYGLQSA